MNPNKSVTALDSVFDHYQEIAGPGSFQKAVQISPFFLLPFRPILSELIRELATQKSLYYPKHQNRAGLHHKLREKILHLRRPWQGPWRAGMLRDDPVAMAAIGWALSRGEPRLRPVKKEKASLRCLGTCRSMLVHVEIMSRLSTGDLSRSERRQARGQGGKAA